MHGPLNVKFIFIFKGKDQSEDVEFKSRSVHLVFWLRYLSVFLETLGKYQNIISSFAKNFMFILFFTDHPNSWPCVQTALLNGLWQIRGKSYYFVSRHETFIVTWAANTHVICSCNDFVILVVTSVMFQSSIQLRTLRNIRFF
jgi:hypothetical protein